MSNPPRIWLDYRPIRIGWVVSQRDITLLAEMASWNACLWGGCYNCVIPAYDIELADMLASCFAVDVLLPVRADTSTNEFIKRYPHLEHHRWNESIFHRGDSEFADVRHVVRRITGSRDEGFGNYVCLPKWELTDPLSALFALQFGWYPNASADIPDYEGNVRSAVGAQEIPITVDQEVPLTILEKVTPLALTHYGTTQSRVRAGWLSVGVVLGSAADSIL